MGNGPIIRQTPRFTYQILTKRERFIREAQSAGALNHPSIVTIYDVDEDPENGSSFIAMEYVEGSSLQHCLETKGRLDPDRAVLLGTTIAEALHVAHTAGIVHRDIKPANILVRDEDGAFKIADFGIARFSNSDLTQEGFTLGSPLYMSPEQLRSQPVDTTRRRRFLRWVIASCLRRCGTGSSISTP